MNGEKGERTMSGTEVTELVSRAVLKGATPAAVLFVAAVVQSFRDGLSARYGLIAAGALLSMILLFAYAAVTKANLESPLPRSCVPMLLTFGGLVPYLFGCYLFLYEGLWRLTQLRHGLSMTVMALAAAFVLGGYWLVSATHQVSEIGKFRKVTPITDSAM